MGKFRFSVVMVLCCFRFTLNTVWRTDAQTYT